MNAKIIILLLVCINIISAGYLYSCSNQGASCGVNPNNVIINYFFDLDQNADLSQTGGLNTDGQFSQAVSDSLQQESSGTSGAGTIAILLDSLKMVLGIISLITPLPILLLFYSFNLPILFSMIFTIPIVVLYLFSLVEFIRGKNFSG